MKVECSQDKIKEAISLAERIAGKHMTLPVLSCVLLDAEKTNFITVRATNLDLGIEIAVPAKVEESGTVAVPASTLSSFINGINENGAKIKIELQQGNIKVSSNKASAVIKTLPHDDFPSIPRVSSGNSFSLNAADFVKGLKSVWYSSSVSSIKAGTLERLCLL
jgi:DNA polymerase-3 subunit beta